MLNKNHSTAFAFLEHAELQEKFHVSSGYLFKKRTGITFFTDDFAVCRKQNPEYYVSSKYGDEPILMMIMKLDENVRMYGHKKYHMKIICD